MSDHRPEETTGFHGEPPTATNGEGDAPEVDVTDLDAEEQEDGVEVDDRP
ncbi:hypothetical protein [Microbacterium paraoxydans]|uniref:Uncharacterized protein n=1 Tax=Microbacterium paraoxydans TaxID=199592 RepID=A0ABS5IMF4_9MICO|nr:hypothetical protein [Microbacterium paraoxydans]MBS0024128.1 hypothetical protein [Microbacterium paraoxydans]